MRALVTGGAGFLGSWLCELLVRRGYEVTCLDNLSSGRLKNVEHLQHLQRENYWGNVNPISLRSCYDGGKFGKALRMACRTRGLHVRIGRIFNTYGPRMRPKTVNP